MRKHFLAVSLIAILVFVVGALATFEESCQVSASDAARAAVDGVPGNGASNGVRAHCLLYGKYCLSDTLRSR
ncbi:hypothetical protein BH160DRAFT_0609 [Burkholderia sp. H160]|nr:hypothetical protein BH160DRAFT_0609 [Burkholderia sp. H160]